MLKILIVEDEIITATDLKETLEKYDFHVIGIANDYQEMKAILEWQLPDLILLDVQLRNSELDGIGIATILNKEYKIPFVFLTANSESDTFKKAKENKPAAYLLKPYRHKELAFQIELAFQHYLANKEVKNYASDNLYLPHKKGYQRINKQEVILLKASGSYVQVFVEGVKTPYTLSMNLKYISQFFELPNFFQLSRSYLINLEFIERFTSDSVSLRGISETISIPQSRKQEFLQQIEIIRTP